jgi:O-methyltransferase involved in polyketide biosynthesis
MKTLNLGDVEETLLMPLYMRALDAESGKPRLNDQAALRIAKDIGLDMNQFSRINSLSSASWIARSLYFDNKIKAFIMAHPDATIINPGCGLDTTFERIDNGKIEWFDLDLVDVIDLKKKLFLESNGRHFIAKSILDSNWTDIIPNRKNVFILFAGLLYYFMEEQVKDIFMEIISAFKSAEIAMDYTSITGVRMANKTVMKEGNIKNSARLQWGIDNIKAIEGWDNRLIVLEDVPMFRSYRKVVPHLKRFPMFISDKMNMMALASIKIKV